MASLELYHSNLAYELQGGLIQSLGLPEKAELIHLDKSYFPNPWNEEGWEMVWKSERPFILFIARADGEIVGFSLYGIEQQEEQFLAHLVKIVVNPKIRRQGVAKKLIQQLEIVQSKGHHNIYLEVEESNLSAIELYKSCGLDYIHTKKHFYGRDRHALIFMKTT